MLVLVILSLYLLGHVSSFPGSEPHVRCMEDLLFQVADVERLGDQFARSYREVGLKSSPICMCMFVTSLLNKLSLTDAYMQAETCSFNHERLTAALTALASGTARQQQNAIWVQRPGGLTLALSHAQAQLTLREGERDVSVMLLTYLSWAD